MCDTAYTTTQQSQYPSTAPNDLAYGAGGQFQDSTDPSTYAGYADGASGNDDVPDIGSPQQPYRGFSSPPPVAPNIAWAAYDIPPRQYDYRSPAQLGYDNESPVDGLAANLRTLQMSRPAPGYQYMNTADYQPTPGPSAPMPVIYNTGQSGNAGDTTAQMTSDETPRQSSNFRYVAGSSGGGGGSGRKGGGTASRVDTIDRQREGNVMNWRPLDEKGKQAYLCRC